MEDQAMYQKLWDKHIAGDKKAFGELYNLFHKRLTMYCIGILRDVPMAENAASETLLKLMSHKEPETINNVERWVFGVAKNYCYSYSRWKSRRENSKKELRLLKAGVNHNHGELDMISDDHEAIAKKHLSEHEYRVWALFLNGYTNKEIAEQLEIAAKTIANIKALVRKKLKGVYKDLGYS